VRAALQRVAARARLAPRAEIILASAVGANDVASPLAACARHRDDDLFHRSGSGCSLSGNCGAAPHERAALKRAIEAFIAGPEDAPDPFQWTASADDILAKVARLAQRSLTAVTSVGNHGPRG